jgi:transposase
MPQNRAAHHRRFLDHAERDAYLHTFVADYNHPRLRCLDYQAPAELLAKLTGHNTTAGGRKRHIITDTVGHLVAAKVHTADIQDRDGAPNLLASIRFLFPWLRHVFADGGYAGEKLAAAVAGHGQWQIEIVKRSDRATGFYVLPRRWVVERTFAWLNRNRRLAKDFEVTVASSEAWLYLASVQLLARRLARSTTNRAPVCA